MTDEPIHESTEVQKRGRLATFFTRLADRFRRGEAVPVDDEQHVTVEPPAEAELDVELTREGDDVQLDISLEWPAEEGEIETDVVASKARFEVYEDAGEQHRWRLVHRNGNIIADSGEGYASKQKANQGLESVRRNAPGAYVVDESKDEESPEEGGSNATFELFEDAADRWRWRLRHDNDNIIADSGQGYASKQKANQGLESVQKNVAGAPVEETDS